MVNKKLWITYFKNYPLSTIQDFIKYLYQSTLGSAHLIENAQDNYTYLEKEYSRLTYDDSHPLYERISNELVRVHLEAIKKEHLKTMHQLFMKSVTVASSKEDLIKSFNDVEKGIKEGWIPFDLKEWQKEIEDYKSKGCPVVSHSEKFRKYYHPHYRLMKSEYVKYLDLLNRIDRLPNQSVIAIDGNSASGKSTLSSFLQDIYHYPIVHMDDFFLQPHQRTSKRLNEIGGNVDYERFLEEVIQPINQKQSFSYQIFDCQSMCIKHEKEILFDSKIIVEGSYSHHPNFKEYADLKVFLEIPNELQKERILKRNGEKMLERFVNEWIPKEEMYFSSFHIKEKADIIIKEDCLFR